MTDDASQYPSDRRDRGDSSGWWAGTALFAALLMIMVGIWQAVVGLIAIFENDFYVATRNYLFQFDATTWGWIHLVVGLIVAFAGWGLLSGQTWARIVGITLAALSATANFLFIPYYPIWSLLIIAVDIFVIWALTVHGRELRQLRDAEAEYRMHR
jgi:cell division protein FtsW (lipid II flippase)